MKKITKIMPIVQAVWVYIIFAIFFGDAGDKINNGAILWLLLGISIVINIITVYSAKIEKDDFKKLAFFGMLLKIVLIPFYFFIFAIGLGATMVLSITGIGLLFAPFVYLFLAMLDYILLLTTSSFGTSAIRILRKKNVFPDKMFVGLQMCHYLFVLDVIASIVLYMKVRKAEDTEEDIQFKKKARKVGKIIIIILIIIMVCFAFKKLDQESRLKRLGEKYSTETHNLKQIEDYADKRFSNTNDYTFTSKVETSKDEYNKDYKEWSIEVDGVKCHVASIETSVLDGFAGEFGHTYYRLDTDYDNIVIKGLIDNKYYMWNTNVDDISERYNRNDLVSIDYDYPLDTYSDGEIDNIVSEMKQIYQDAKNMNVEKEIYYCFNKGDNRIIVTGDELLENNTEKMYD